MGVAELSAQQQQQQQQQQQPPQKEGHHLYSGMCPVPSLHPGKRPFPNQRSRLFDQYPVSVVTLSGARNLHTQFLSEISDKNRDSEDYKSTCQRN